MADNMDKTERLNDLVPPKEEPSRARKVLNAPGKAAKAVGAVHVASHAAVAGVTVFGMSALADKIREGMDCAGDDAASDLMEIITGQPSGNRQSSRPTWEKYAKERQESGVRGAVKSFVSGAQTSIQGYMRMMARGYGYGAPGHGMGLGSCAVGGKSVGDDEPSY